MTSSSTLVAHVLQEELEYSGQIHFCSKNGHKYVVSIAFLNPMCYICEYYILESLGDDVYCSYAFFVKVNVKSWDWLPPRGPLPCTGMWSVAWKASWLQDLVGTVVRWNNGLACTDEKCFFISWYMDGRSEWHEPPPHPLSKSPSGLVITIMLTLTKYFSAKSLFGLSDKKNSGSDKNFPSKSLSRLSDEKYIDTNQKYFSSKHLSGLLLYLYGF